MKRILYYIFFSFVYCITLLPLRVLYIFSDLLFLLLYYFPSYRRGVVENNLRNSFPEKSDKEIKSIARKFYRHLADLFIESIKAIHMSPDEIKRRMVVRDMPMVEQLFSQGRDILAVCSHYNNWEWMSSFSLNQGHKTYTIYKPLANKYFDRLMYSLRAKYGVIPVPMNTILRSLITSRKEKTQTISAFIADQTPPKGDHVYWTRFLNQETSFYSGPEKVATMLDMTVVFIHIYKVRRGYYEIEFTPLCENPKSEEPGAITEKHVRMLENIIKEKPEYWLWSHRRWKHKRPVNE